MNILGFKIFLHKEMASFERSLDVLTINKIFEDIDKIKSIFLDKNQILLFDAIQISE